MKYYKNSVTVEWLSNEPWGDEAEDLGVVSYEITDGNSIGYITRTIANQELSREEAVAADISYGGDGTFITRLLEDEEES